MSKLVSHYSLKKSDTNTNAFSVHTKKTKHKKMFCDGLAILNPKEKRDNDKTSIMVRLRHPVNEILKIMSLNNSK